MRCPTCGFHSFEHLDECKKCGQDLTEFKARYGIFSSRSQQENRSRLVNDQAGFPDLNPDLETSVSEKAEEDIQLPDPEFWPSEKPEQVQKPEKSSEMSFSFAAEPEAGDILPDEEGSESQDNSDRVFDFSNEFEPGAEEGFDVLAADAESAAEDQQETQSYSEAVAGKAETGNPLEDQDELPAVDTLDQADTGQEWSSDLLDFENFPQTNDFSEISPGSFAMDSEQKTATLSEDAPGTEFGDEPQDREQDLKDILGEEPSLGIETYPADEEVAAESQVFPRLGAWLADCAILSVIFLAFVILGKIGLSSHKSYGLFPTHALLLVELLVPYFFLFFVLCFGYFTVFHFLTGQTPGKMFFNIRVEDEKGFPLMLSQAFLRSSGGLLSLLLLGFGYLIIFFNPDRKGWNDRLAGTRVVRILPQ